VVVGTIVTSSITQPLTALDAGARALAAGNFEHRVPVKGNDELTHLAFVFNQTSGEVARLFEEVRREHAKTEAAQTALQERAQELARANADLEQFAYSATHDLKEPLRVISLYSQLLHRKYAGRLDQDAEQFIDYLFRAAHQMEQLITDLLAYTRTANVNKVDEARTDEARTDVNAVLATVLATLELQIRECRCRLTVEPLPTVRAHEVHVQQLFQNLIGNSLKYRSDHDPQIQVSAEPKNGDWLFTVRDNGIGIDPQYTRQIFGIFKRLHGQKYPGTGIGLAICQRIVEGYGGRIWVESQLGQGAAFRFTLPAA
jgi:light-regulated signal transduction histidine kinase (bacteriophytochrome)